MSLLKIISASTTLMLIAPAASADLWKDPVSIADWSVTAKPSVVDRKFSNDAMARFLDNFAGIDRDTLDPEDDDLPIKPSQIGDFKWIDIDKDGVYELFVAAGESRQFYRGPTIYKMVNGRPSLLQGVGGWPPNQTIDSALEDLDGDGTPEIIARSFAVYYRGAATSSWTTIYRWNGQRFIDASTSFKDFYAKRLLPEVQARIREIRLLMPSPTGQLTEQASRELAQHELSLATQWVVHDKILRLTGQNAHAGIDRAREWSKSPNRELRTLAAEVFGDAGLETYRADLQLLFSDPDPYVSEHVEFVRRIFSTK